MALGSVGPEVVVKFLADTSGLTKGLAQAEGGTKSFGSSVKGMGKAAAIAGGAAGVAALVGTVKLGIDEFAEAAKVGAQTEAVLKSTGGAAGVTAKQVSDLAGALMEKSGVDDEAIQSGENLLLTFTGIRNEAGKGNDVFTQATKTMLDMSVALGQDNTQSAIQLGKALNDPIKGVTALRKVGVSFTTAQQDQIGAMVKAGNVMGAQKLILGELKKEFGGSAEAAGKTLPGQLNIAKQSFSNLAGTLVGLLAPAFLKITKFLTEHPTLFKALALSVLAVAAAMVVLNVALAVTSVVASPIIGIVLGVIAALALLSVAAYLVYKNWDKIMDALKRAAGAVLAWLRSNWPLLVGILTGPLGLAVALVIRHWDKVKAVTSAAWAAVKNTVSSVLGSLRGAVSTFVGWFVSAFNGVRTALGKVAEWFSIPLDAARAAVSGIRGAFSGLVSYLAGIVSNLGRIAGNIADAIRRPINALIGAWNGLSLSVPTIHIPGVPAVKILGKTVFPGWGGTTIGGQTWPFPKIPRLAKGGVFDTPTLALVGEAGREVVTPESLLRSVVASAMPEVHVFIGDTELKDLVRVEVVSVDNATAAALMGGVA